MICRIDVPAKYITIFWTSLMTTAKWKDLIIDARTDKGDSEGEDDGSNNEGAEDEDIENDNGSIPSGFDEGEDYMTEAKMTEEAFEVAWDCSLVRQVGGDANWAPTAQAHRTAIDLLGSILNSSTKQHITCRSVLLAPEEFCFLTASPVEKVTGALMLLSIGMFGPQDRMNNVRK